MTVDPEDDPYKEMLRSKRGFLEYVALGIAFSIRIKYNIFISADFSWLHKFLEMVFGDLYTDIMDNKNAVPLPLIPSTKSPFEGALRPWVKNITSLSNNETTVSIFIN